MSIANVRVEAYTTEHIRTRTTAVLVQRVVDLCLVGQKHAGKCIYSEEPRQCDAPTEDGNRCANEAEWEITPVFPGRTEEQNRQVMASACSTHLAELVGDCERALR